MLLPEATIAPWHSTEGLATLGK